MGQHRANVVGSFRAKTKGAIDCRYFPRSCDSLAASRFLRTSANCIEPKITRDRRRGEGLICADKTHNCYRRSWLIRARMMSALALSLRAEAKSRALRRRSSTWSFCPRPTRRRERRRIATGSSKRASKMQRTSPAPDSHGVREAATVCASSLLIFGPSDRFSFQRRTRPSIRSPNLVDLVSNLVGQRLVFPGGSQVEGLLKVLERLIFLPASGQGYP